MSIGAGADEVMLSIICKYMDTLPKKWHLQYEFSLKNKVHLKMNQTLNINEL